MKVAVLSDIHDNTHNLVLAFQKIKELWCERILFLWDFAGEWAARILASSELPVYAIWGNNDGEKVRITKVAMDPNNKLEIADKVYDNIEIDNRKIFLVHFPDIVQSMAKSGDFDAVFYGHDHTKHLEKIGDCLVANPGELATQKFGEATFMVYNTTTNEAEHIKLDNIVNLKTPEVDAYREQIAYNYNQSKSHKY